MIDKLQRYIQLRDNLSDNNLIRVCVARYEINLIKYELTKNEKYKLIMEAIGKILDTFLDIEFAS